MAELFLIPLTIIALAFWLDEPATEKIVLLPDEDGNVGTVVVQSAEGQQTLNTAFAAVAVQEGGALTAKTESRESVEQQFGSMLDAAPPQPQSFVVYFESGSGDELTPASMETVAAMQTFLATRPAPEISVIGHTDRVGKLADNDQLSYDRAETVLTLIKEAGISAVSMDASGRGEREPVVATSDEVPESRNRRVEINVR